MIWGPGAIYGFARAARFRPEQWAPITALALATSGGDDAFRDCPAPGRVVDRRGLWGVDVVARPDLADRDLYDPRTAAQVAHALTVAAQGSYDWSTVAVPAVLDPQYQAAMQAIRNGITTQDVDETAQDSLTGDPAGPVARLLDSVQYLQHKATGGM